jgi:sugar phosphate isomerase/epimerase
MSSSTDYRNHAEVCLRMIDMTADERDKPLWATMAQSWLRLAEHAERAGVALESENLAEGEDAGSSH